LGYKVPHGWVDTAYHISVALDVKEGNFDSLFHPWWHLPNRVFNETLDIVDRNSKSFFYPPFLHIVLALCMFFTHPGVAAIVCVSFLYSLSVISMFLLSKSFGLGNSEAYISSLLICFSASLLFSQNFGFWSFSVSLIFLILSFSFLKFYLKEGKTKLLALSLIFGSLSTLIHWVVGAILLIVSALLFDSANIDRNKKFFFSFGILYLLSILIFLTFTDTFSYQVTYFYQFFWEIPVLYFLAFVGWILAFKKEGKNLIHFLPVAAFLLMFLFYFFQVKIPFADMVQFTIPFFTAFYISYTYKLLNGKIKTFYSILLAFLLTISFFNTLKIQLTTQPSLTNKQFDSLLNLRSTFSPNSTTILGMKGEYGYWITIVSKNSKILNPFNMTISKSISQNFQFYLIEPNDDSFALVLIK
jgi:hypothetical protein